MAHLVVVGLINSTKRLKPKKKQRERSFWLHEIQRVFAQNGNGMVATNESVYIRVECRVLQL
jgi:hypothetical protein